MGVEGRVAVAIGWVAVLVALAAWSNTDAASVAAVLVTVLAAALIARWWVVLIPAPTALVLIFGSVLAGSDVDSDGISGWEWALGVAAITGAVMFLLALGVLAGRTVGRLRERRTS
jgi:hypothetical protein